MRNWIVRRCVLATGFALAATPAAAQAPDVEITWPVFANVIVTGSGNLNQPTWRIESLGDHFTLGDNVAAEAVDVTAEWKCAESFQPGARFTLLCEPVRPPSPIRIPDPSGDGETTVNRTWACDNPVVRAEVDGPAPLESVTGRIDCKGTTASCTATALAVWTTGFRGACASSAQPGRVPLYCYADLSNVTFDDWSVTCQGTDP